MGGHPSAVEDYRRHQAELARTGKLDSTGTVVPNSDESAEIKATEKVSGGDTQNGYGRDSSKPAKAEDQIEQGLLEAEKK